MPGLVTIPSPPSTALGGSDQPPTSAATRPPAPVSSFQSNQHKFASASSCCPCRPRSAPFLLLWLLLPHRQRPCSSLKYPQGKKHSPPPGLQAANPPCEVSHHRAPIRTGGLLLSNPPRRPRPVDLRGGRRARWRSRSGSSARCWRFVPFFSSKRASPSLAGPPIPCALHGPFRIREEETSADWVNG